MKINLARSAGFCSGVKRALALALETARTRSGVCMLGDIVHNENVVRQIECARIRKIERICDGKGKTLIISAHGAGQRTYGQAARAGWRIVDATCPMVTQIHYIARDRERKGYTVIVIGDRLHTEVKGIIGQLKKKALVIDHKDRLPVRRLRAIKKAAVVVQSTQNLDAVNQLIARLRRHVRNLEFINTICQPTRIKQNEIKSLPLANDAVIIIGSRRSANTRRLYEISRSLNRCSYWVHSPDEIKKEWFKNVRSLGITAGASTPESIIQDVIKHIRRITKGPG